MAPAKKKPAAKKVRKVKLSRTFGGKGNTDLFKLMTEKNGLTKTAAKAKAKALRADGYAAVVDPLGGKDRYGVYARKAHKRGRKKA